MKKRTVKSDKSPLNVNQPTKEMEKVVEDKEESSEILEEQEKAKPEVTEDLLKEIEQEIEEIKVFINNLNKEDKNYNKNLIRFSINLKRLEKDKAALIKTSKPYDGKFILFILFGFFLLMFFSRLKEELFRGFNWDSSSDLYEDLELAVGSNRNDIKRKFRELVLKYHPDKNPNCRECPEKYLKVQNAYEILGDEEKKEIYDQTNGITHIIKSKAVELNSHNYEDLVLESFDLWVIQVYDNRDYNCQFFSKFWEENISLFPYVKFGRVNFTTAKGLLSKLPFGVKQLPFIIFMGKSYETQFLVFESRINTDGYFKSYMRSAIGFHLMSYQPKMDLNAFPRFVFLRMMDNKIKPDRFEFVANYLKTFYEFPLFINKQANLNAIKIKTANEDFEFHSFKTETALELMIDFIFFHTQDLSSYYFNKISYQKHCKNEFKVCIVIPFEQWEQAGLPAVKRIKRRLSEYFSTDVYYDSKNLPYIFPINYSHHPRFLKILVKNKASLDSVLIINHANKELGVIASEYLEADLQSDNVAAKKMFFFEIFDGKGADFFLEADQYSLLSTPFSFIYNKFTSHLIYLVAIAFLILLIHTKYKFSLTAAAKITLTVEIFWIISRFYIEYF